MFFLAIIGLILSILLFGRYEVLALLCACGILGNSSSFFVLIRNLAVIPSARLLLGLTLADTMVLVSAFVLSLFHILTSMNLICWNDTWNRMQDVCFATYYYFYFCSIYMTVALSLDRYLVTTRPLLLRQINYKKFQGRVQAAVFVVSLALALPGTIGRFIKVPICTHHETYDYYGPTDPIGYLYLFCAHSVCNDTVTYVYQESMYPYDYRLDPTPSRRDCSRVRVDIDVFQPLKRCYCNGEDCTTHDSRTFIIRKGTEKCFTYRAYYYRGSLLMNVHEHVPFFRPLFLDSSFILGYSFGVVFPVRYLLPMVVLAWANIRLVQAVRRGQRAHRSLVENQERQAPVEAQDTGILKTAVTVSGGFLLLHTLALGLDISLLVHTFYTGPNSTPHSKYPRQAVTSLYQITIPISSLNSAINLAIYCWFLPQFRKRWLALWPCKMLASPQTAGTPAVVREEGSRPRRRVVQPCVTATKVREEEPRSGKGRSSLVLLQLKSGRKSLGLGKG